MTSTYRDDLEAALIRADDLEREVAELRERNQRMEAALENGDSAAPKAELAARVAPDEYTNRPIRLVATRGGLAFASLAIGALGALGVHGAITDDNIGLAIVVGLVFGGFVTWLNLIPRDEPPGRIQ
jgi:hypothetical protein